jgi:sulfate adenylyltransferase subunit 1
VDGGAAADAGQSYDIKIAGKKTRARVDGIQFQVDINNLTQREVESCR